MLTMLMRTRVRAPARSFPVSCFLHHHVLLSELLLVKMFQIPNASSVHNIPTVALAQMYRVRRLNMHHVPFRCGTKSALAYVTMEFACVGYLFDVCGVWTRFVTWM